MHEGWSGKIGEGPLSGRALLRDAKFLDTPRNKIGEPSTVLLGRTAILSTGWFSTKLVQALDYEYWYRLMTRHDLYFTDRPLSAFRLHGGQASVANRNRNYNRGGKETVLLYQSYFAHLLRHVAPQIRHEICKLLWRHYLDKARHFVRLD